MLKKLNGLRISLKKAQASYWFGLKSSSHEVAQLEKLELTRNQLSYHKNI
jgi:hypothetical protein